VIRLLLPVAITMALCSTAAADGPTDPAGEQWVSKKDQYMADKAATADATTDADRAKATAKWDKQLDRLVGKKPKNVINVFNGWTHEYITVNAGKHTEKVSDDTVNEFLRCHFTNQPTQMDKKLFVALIKAAKHFSVDKIIIVSAYRSPKYNLMLRKKGREVAKNSQHTHGKAVDFRLPGIEVTRLHKWAKSLKMGGVGLYRGSGFIHIDTGKVRYWGGE
jgi:uncharacterized protein YcbK (DUF882 family)